MVANYHSSDGGWSDPRVGFSQVVQEQPNRRVSVVVESKGLEGGMEDEDEERHICELACFPWLE
jgi:hypothetical protein